MEPAKDLTTSLASLWQDPFTRPNGALFLSSRTAEIFVQSIPQSLKKAMQQDLQNVCLSHSVADPLKKAGFKHVYAAKHPDFEALLTLLSQVSL
jgi:uroporphyrinogen-III synthase